MKIAVCQINITVGDFEGNYQKIKAGLAWAHKQKADLALFPELAVIGYPPRDLLDRPYLIDACEKVVEAVVRDTQELGVAALFGTVSRNPSGWGRGLYNTAVFAAEGKVVALQHKTLLPQYDVFDEARHFDAANEYPVVSFQGRKIGISLCEDIWSSHDFNGRKLYAADPIENLKKNGADLLLNISASPFSVGKHTIRRQLLNMTAKKFGFPIVYCNLLGGNDELVFDGRSLVVNEKGLPVHEGKAFEEDFFIVDTDHLDAVDLPSPEGDCEDIYNALVLGLKDYVYKCGFKKVLLGLSGGIDSALVAVIAAKALGGENVLGVMMPSEYSSQGSIDDSIALAKKIKIQTRTIPIADIYNQFLGNLALAQEKAITLTHENIQPRIRGTLLMALSNQSGSLLLSTGNKSELSCGYCTLYGDMAGGFAMLADLTKTNVYALCEWINRKEEIIPKAILTKPPSAELKPDQKDQDTLPPYDLLDAILQRYVEEHQSVEAIIGQGFAPEVVRRVAQMIDRNEYKRRQAPPGIKLTSKAFGMGRRFPIAWNYKPMEGKR